MGERQQNTASRAPINLEQARAELVRAEALLKQRHANTRLVLEKQKEITAQLQDARALVSSLQRRLKEEVRQKEKHKADSLEKDVTIAELRLQLRKASRQANSQSVTHPQTPSDEDIRSVLSERIRERSERSHRSQKSQLSHRSGFSADSMTVSRRDGKRKVREEAGVDKRDMLVDMLDFVLDGAETGCSIHARVNAATDNYLEEIPAEQDSWAAEVAEAALGVLLDTCVLREVVGQWADMAWSPSRWFECAGTKQVSPVGRGREEEREEEWSPDRHRRSMVATWCDPRRLEADYIPWLVACLRDLEDKSRQRVTYILLDRCIDEVLLRCSGTADVRAVPQLCCAVTVAIALCKMSGRRGLDLGMKLLVDIMGQCGPGAKNRIVALAVALEVWPELAVVVACSAVDFADAVDADSEHNDVYEMAALTLRVVRT